MSVEAEMVPGTGLEPVRSCLRGIFVLATAFAADRRTVEPLVVWSLDFLFVVSRDQAREPIAKVRQGPSSLYTFPRVDRIESRGLSSGLQARREVRG